MKISALHDWDVSYHEARAIQLKLATQLAFEFPDKPVSLVAGTDVSYSKTNPVFFAGVVVMRFPDGALVDRAFYSGRVSFPYVPGLLSFREAPPLLQAFRRLKTVPDVVLCDGHGIAHPRGFGLASHIGLWLDLPTIGCAKNHLIGTYAPVRNEVGAFSVVQHEQKTVGAALRSKKNVKPIFISPGHKIDLMTSLEIVLRTFKGYRIPEPIRQAHIFVNGLRRSAMN